MSALDTRLLNRVYIYIYIFARDWNLYTCASLQVTYDTTGFLEKNRDLLHLDSIQLLSSCTRDLPQTFASYMLTHSEKPVVGPLHKSGGADSQKSSVTTKFKVHLIFTVVFIWFQYQFCGYAYIFQLILCCISVFNPHFATSGKL